MSVEYWNNIYKNKKEEKIVYDNWLNQYLDIFSLSKNRTILDLGCGSGNDTLFLIEKGYSILSVDNSIEALNIVKTINSNTMLVDISKPLPFEDGSFDIIIADLSLHYFDELTTNKIMNEIKRILSKNGYLLARVNSTEDVYHGSSNGLKIEHHFYLVDSINKRFFDENDVINFFSVIGKTSCQKKIMKRYEKEKVLYEVKVQKVK